MYCCHHNKVSGDDFTVRRRVCRLSTDNLHVLYMLLMVDYRDSLHRNTPF